MLVAAALVIPVIAVETSSPGEPWEMLAGITNWLIWIAFLVELVVMLWVVPDRWAWIRGHPLEVAIVLLTPPFASALLQGIRGVRLLRLLRLLPVFVSARLAQRVFSLTGVRYVAVLAGLAVVGGGAAFASIENGHRSEPLDAWDGLWWAITTATTVGYGDIYPETDGGRLLAIGLMVVGIAFVGFLTAAIAQRFILPVVEEGLGRVEETQSVDDHDLLRQLTELRGHVDRLEASIRNRSAG